LGIYGLKSKQESHESKPLPLHSGKQESNVGPEYGSGPADPYKVREAWCDFVVPAARIGKLDKLKTVKARTPRERQAAKNQNYYLSRRSFGDFGPNYDLIRWN